jgi:hypothetical protein
MAAGFPETMLDSAFDRLAALVRRELGASDVRLLDRAETPPNASNVVHHRLDDARTVVATFESEQTDVDAVRRRLAMLVDTFAESLADPAGERFRAARHSVSSSLFEELRALAVRAQSLDVVVVDADSPIVWGSSRGGVLPSGPPVPLADVSRPRLVQKDDGSAPEMVGEKLVAAEHLATESAPAVGEASTDKQDVEAVANPDGSQVSLMAVPKAEDDLLVEEAVSAVRKLAETEHVHKGRTLRHVHRDQERGLGYLTLSFSGIYLLVLVYRGTFDELRAERAAHEALPRIERLVLALPPFDPEPQPQGQVVSLRRRR